VQKPSETNFTIVPGLVFLKKNQMVFCNRAGPFFHENQTVLSIFQSELLIYNEKKSYYLDGKYLPPLCNSQQTHGNLLLILLDILFYYKNIRSR
jgi:hypothetical protein